MYSKQYIAALIMFVSGCLIYSADVDDFGWQALLVAGRFVAGLGHGLTFVTVLVQASENAARNFRRILVTIIGGCMAFSIFLASTFLIYLPVPFLQDDVENTAVYSETRSAGVIATATFVFSFLSVPLNYFFSHETIPFLLYHNYREEEAQFTLAKLLGEDNDAPLVQYEFNCIKEACHSDYAEFAEGKIFTTIHRHLLAIALNGRIAAAQSFGVPIIVLFVKIIQAYYMHKLQADIGNSMYLVETDTKTTSENSTTEEEVIFLSLDWDKLRNDLSAYNTAVKSLLFSWFVFGLLFACLANRFHWRRGLHLATFIAGASILICLLFVYAGVLVNFIAALTFLVLIIYFEFLTLPIDILGLNYLLECFPSSTRAWSIGFVTIIECLFNICIVGIDIRYAERNPEIIPMGIILCLVGFKLYKNVPETFGFSLVEAKHAYIQATAGKKWWQF